MPGKISSDMEKALKVWDQSDMDAWNVAKLTDVTYQGLMSALKASDRVIKNRSGIWVRKISRKSNKSLDLVK